MRTAPPPSGRGLRSWELGLRTINPDPPSSIPIHISRLVGYPARQGLPSSFPSLPHHSLGVARCCNCGNWASEPSTAPLPLRSQSATPARRPSPPPWPPAIIPAAFRSLSGGRQMLQTWENTPFVFPSLLLFVIVMTFWYVLRNGLNFF